MARVNDRVKVKVKDMGLSDGKRVFTLNLVVNKEMISTSELLAGEGAVEKIEKRLISALKDTVVSYGKDGKEVLREAKSVGKARRGIKRGKILKD